MITREQIPQVVGHPVHDSEGKKIGDAKHMYLDDATGEPEWVTVRTGMFGNNETFVPTRAASLVQDHLEIPYDKDTVKGAPNVDVDSGGHLSVEEEQHLYRYYGMEGSGGSPGRGRGERAAEAGAAGAAGGMAASSGRHAKAGGTQSGAEGARMGAAAGAGTRGTGGETTARTDKEAAAHGGMSGSEAGAGTGMRPGTRGYAAERAAASERRTAGEDDAMTRSEEELIVNVERHAAGRARLHKYVEVEDVERTVPVRREEVRLEREPITEKNRDAALAGPDISEAEHVVTLHEEEAVIDTRVVPKERVRMRIEEHTEQKTVHGRVRKERIEADMLEEGEKGTDKAGGEPGKGRRDKRFG